MFFHSISFWIVFSVWSYLRTFFIVSDFTSEPPFPSLYQILPQNYLPSLILPQNLHLYILQCILRPNFLSYSLPCCCSVTLLCLMFSYMDCGTPRFPHPSLFLRACSNAYPIKSMMPSNLLILCQPLLHSLPSIFPNIKLFFQWVGCSHKGGQTVELQHQH